MTSAGLFLEGRFQELADQIDSRAFDPRTARILTVFNSTTSPFAGIVAFFVSMTWSSEKPLPAVRIIDPSNRQGAPVRIDDYVQGDGRVAFTLVFEVDAVPVQGYKSYVAEYAASGPHLRCGLPASECIVIETIPQDGVLPLSMSFC